MRDFFDNLNERIRESMVGRYGTDEFSKFLLTVSLILFVLSLFVRTGWLYFFAVLLLIWAYYRILSKNFENRRKENEQYLKFSAGLRKQGRSAKRRFDGRKDYRYFKCPGCGQEVRVPKGKGRIRITCPRCHTQFDRTV